MVRVMGLEYDGSRVMGTIMGHPNTALDKAHTLCTQIYGPLVRWRFVSINYKVPDDNELASNGYINFEATELEK